MKKDKTVSGKKPQFEGAAGALEALLGPDDVEVDLRRILKKEIFLKLSARTT